MTPALRAGLGDPDPAARGRALAEANELNRAAMLKAQKAGVAYLSNATIDGAFALSVCIVNHRTREEDLHILLREVRAAANA